MLLPKQFRRIINPQPRAENWLHVMRRLIPEQFREALVGDILEDCQELRQQEEHGEWWMRAFVCQTCLSAIVMLWASVVADRLLGMILNAIVKHSRKNTALMLAITLIAMVFFVYTPLADVSNHNLLVSRLWAAELLFEIGPDFELAKREHVELLRRYVVHMEQERQSLVLRLLLPQNTKPLRSALSALEQSRPGEAKKTIQKAGMELSHLYINRKIYPTLPIRRQKYKSLPFSLSYDIDRARSGSDSRLSEFKQHPTMKNSTNLCMDDRRTALLLFLAAREYNIPDLIQSFLQHAEVVVQNYTMPTIKAKAIREGWHDFLLRRIAEEEHRISLLRAMSKGDLNEARKILIEMIEHAEELNQILKSGKVEHTTPFL